ncbi:flagellin [Anaerosalibacter bizertensis]|uniref:flagellin N-terminal helical domain-containing protein n=1 Tax=Anaerosalibacter bizertensis TaxID=932217 RepID=UPI001C0EDE23|nr:flagellin [Anaerosalibacter bizertensis]MBU5293045.1 flagellin [Anaerosalibacter bizertensis]
MRINNNMMAMNANRQLGINNNGTAKSLEKLSSGFRINRAGDDAAGLAISEKMRGQIRGLNMASKNAQDGISLIQTAEGALDETHAILQRMRELAVQSANDTNVGVDRNEIQKEVDQLSAELTRIADTTEFNTQNLLGGDFKAKFHVGANSKQNVDLDINAMGAEALKVAGFLGEKVDVSGVTGVSVKNLTGEEVTIKYTALKGKDDAAVEKTTVDVSEDGKSITITLAQAAGDGENVGDITATKGDIVKALESTGLVKVEVAEGTDLTANLDATNAIPGETTVAAGTVNKETGINVSSQKAADASITTINNAIETVSAERSKLGAMQNRLEHTIKNLDNAAENLQAAESRIRDVDMAKEMMEFTKQNILQQASTAMLAQANSLPQGVLQLLR